MSDTTSLPPWFELDNERYKKEINSLSEVGILCEEDATEKADGILQLSLTIPRENKIGIALENTLTLTAVYPDSYPFFKPEFFSNELELQRHQHPISKNLCLSPRGSETWDVDETVSAYLCKQLPILLQKGKEIDYTKIASDPSEQAEPISEYFKEPRNLIILSDLPPSGDFPEIDRQKVEEIKFQGSFKFALDNHSQEFQRGEPPTGKILKFIISGWINPIGKTVANLPLEFTSGLKAKHLGVWFRINELPLDNKRRMEIIKKITQDSNHSPLGERIKIKDEIITSLIALSFPEEIEKGKFGWGLLFILIIRKNSDINALLIAPTRIGQNDFGIRIPKLSKLKEKTVSIAGLGSLGAPSAIELARNGIKALRLLDYDIAEPAPSVRWPLGYEYAGMYKSIALKEFIRHNYPFTNALALNHRFGVPRKMNHSNRPESTVLDQFLRDTSLIYDAAGDLAISNLLFSEAYDRKIPYISVEARPGVWGGLIMRYNPEKKDTGCWMCFRHHLFEGSIERPPQDPTADIQTGGCGDLTFIGTSFELQNISLAGVRLVASTLCNDKNGYPDMDWDVAVLSLVNRETKNLTLPTWKPYKLNKHPKCHYCAGK